MHNPSQEHFLSGRPQDFPSAIPNAQHLVEYGGVNCLHVMFVQTYCGFGQSRTVPNALYNASCV